MEKKAKNNIPVKEAAWILPVLKTAGVLAILMAALILFFTKCTGLYLHEFVGVCTLSLFGICLLVIPVRAYRDAYWRIFLALLAIPPLLGLAALMAVHSSLQITDLKLADWAGFFGGILTYLGVAILTLQMFHQNQKIQQSNQNYQKICVIPYVSFITVTYLSCKQVPPEVLAFEKGNFQGEQINFACGKGQPVKYFLVDFTARNSSDYPITSIRAKCSFCAGAITKYEDDVSVYITEHQTDTVRIAIPIDEALQNSWEQNDEAFIALDIFTTNVLEFTTKGMIFVRFIQKKQTDITYRVAQISEMNPFLKSE